MGQQQDVVEQAVAQLRTHKDQIIKLAPLKLLIHFPPPESKDKVVLDIAGAKLKADD